MPIVPSFDFRLRAALHEAVICRPAISNSFPYITIPDHLPKNHSVSPLRIRLLCYDSA
jgi:hypothetical protein